MKVEQIKDLVNTTTQEVLGEEAIQTEDLSNIVEIGDQIQNLNAMDNYVKTLIDHIGKMVFVDRPYQGSAPSVLMDGWEYGSILEKVKMNKLPVAEENDSWKLQNGQSYDPNVFNAPEVSAKFYDSKTTFDVQMSFAEKQVKSAFSSAQQLNSFFSMIQTGIDNSLTVKVDSLVMRTINAMTAQTLVDYNASGNYSGAGNPRAVNLLAQYNTRFGKSLTAMQAITDAEFIRWASFMIGLYSGRISKLSTLFNIGGNDRFTAPDRMHLVMLDEFAQAANVYLQSDTFHEQYTALPNAETVPFWQGSGADYGFDSTSAINVTVKTADGKTANVNTDGILAVMFDRDALGVCNTDRRVTTNYNARAEFFNNWYKFDAGYFNDPDENFVVFYLGEAA